MKATKMRKKSVTTGIILILGILIGSTFAFVQLNQLAFNPDGVGIFPGGRIHDVFELRGEFDMHGERNKNVFAENFGDIPIGVRVQFREFVRIAGDVLVPTMAWNDPDTWVPFEADAQMIDGQLVRRSNSVAAVVGNLGISWELGQLAGEEKIFMPTFNHINRPLTELEIDHSIIYNPLLDESLFAHQFAYQFSDASGRAVDALTDDFNLGSAADVWGMEMMGEQTGVDGHTGLQDFWYNGQAHSGFLYEIDEAARLLMRRPATHYARPTLVPLTQIDDFNFNGVMTLERWIELDMPAGNFWIMDTENDGGWFYWNGTIESGYATSLLLNSTDLPLLERLEYVIYINSDFFTVDNLPDGINDDVRLIFERQIFVEGTEHADISQHVDLGATVTVSDDVALLLYAGVRTRPIENPAFIVTIMTDNTASATDAFMDDYLVLVVDPNEINTTIEIKVTEPRAENYRIFEIEIDRTVEQGLANFPSEPLPEIGDRCEQTGMPANIFIDSTGFQWCVVAIQGNYALLVARYSLQMSGIDGVDNNQMHNTNQFVEWPETTDAPLPPLDGSHHGLGPAGRTRIHTWFDGPMVSNELRANAVHANIPLHNPDTDWMIPVNDPRFLSTPISGTLGAETPVFFLTQSEILIYMQQPPAALQRRNYRVADYQTNGVFASSGTTASYWLRSAGNFQSQVAAITSGGGNTSLLANNTGNLNSFRPAIWIRAW